jgi:hypothetical protein
VFPPAPTCSCTPAVTRWCGPLNGPASSCFTGAGRRELGCLARANAPSNSPSSPSAATMLAKAKARAAALAEAAKAKAAEIDEKHGISPTVVFHRPGRPTVVEEGVPPQMMLACSVAQKAPSVCGRSLLPTLSERSAILPSVWADVAGIADPGVRQLIVSLQAQIDALSRQQRQPAMDAAADGGGAEQQRAVPACYDARLLGGDAQIMACSEEDVSIREALLYAQQARRRDAFLHARGAAFFRCCHAGGYLSLAIALPSPGPCAAVTHRSILERGYVQPTKLQLAQRRLAYAYAAVASSGGDGDGDGGGWLAQLLAEHLDRDVHRQLCEESLGGQQYPTPFPLIFEFSHVDNSTVRSGGGSFDTNGVLHAIATQYGQREWKNPALADDVHVKWSNALRPSASRLSKDAIVSSFVSGNHIRANVVTSTSDTRNSYMQVDLGW